MELQLSNRPRKKMNKKSLQRTLEEGKIPASIYGRKIESTPVFVHARTLRGWHEGSMFDVNWDDQEWSASVDELQRDPVTGRVHHVSFHLVGKDVVRSIEVPVRTKGKAAGEKAGGLVALQVDRLPVKGIAAAIPDAIEVNVEALQLNGKMTFADITLPAGLEWDTTHMDQTVVTCAPVRASVTEESTGDALGIAAEGHTAVEVPREDA